MPVISKFYGILVYIYQEVRGHHNELHIHVKYNEYEMLISIDGKILEGRLYKKQKKLIDACIVIHEEELKDKENLKKLKLPACQ